MKKYNRIGILFAFASWIIGVSLINVCDTYATTFEREEGKEYVIVIDAGHGGTEKGAQYGGIEEKDINLLVANAMANELSKYDNVTIHFTHETADETLSIKERAEFADEINADYFFCLHFNASGNHNFYGSETWVTSYGRYYSEMYGFSQILLEDFEEIGLFNRGIKTKLETDGTDYYGVLRRNGEFDIPAVIIEHCHMDNANDSAYLDSEEDFELFGKIDATAVAKFLGLKSEELGVDYSDYEVILPEEPLESIPNDTTNPSCSLEFGEDGVVILEADDDEHDVIYYGIGFEADVLTYELQPWNKEESLLEIDLDELYEWYNSSKDSDILYAVVFNAFNLQSETASINVGEYFKQLEAEQVNESEEVDLVQAREEITPLKGGEIYLVIAILCIILSIIVVVRFIRDVVKDTKKGGNDNYIM